MTETPTERAARAHYLHQAVTRDGFTEKQALANWKYCPETDNWRALRVQAMAAAIAEYEAAKAEERRKSCKHPRQTGSGSIGYDGSGSRTWFCPDCGDHGSRTWPARAEPQSTLPDWDDLRGRAPDATGDLSSETFVRKLRGDWPTTETPAEPDAPQPRKEGPVGETSDTLGRSIWGARQARKEGA